MNILTDRKNGIVKWSYNNKDILIQNPSMIYAFEYGNEMVMLKLKNQDGKVEFSLYDVNGGFILSYSSHSDEITIGTYKSIQMNDLISVEYSKKDKKVIALIGMRDEERKLVIMDYGGNIITNIINPPGYTFYSTKNIGNTILVVCRGNSDVTRDKYGRNDWSFRIDLDNYYAEKISVTQ